MNNEEIIFKDCPLMALSDQTAKKLSSLLNTKKVFHSETGYERDWRGLATLAEQRSFCDETAMPCDNPMERVLELWCENKPDTATFENLIFFLGLIDRWHIIEDLEEDLQEDFRNYQTSIMNERVTYNNNNQALDINTNTTVAVPLKTINNNVALTSCNGSATFSNDKAESTYGSDSKLLTSNDVKRSQQGLPLQQYDAFVLYADADFNYGMEILNKLQFNSEYNLKFCLKDDLLFGILFEHVALMELIKERCTFLIVILTKEFNKSPENKFLVNYTQALQIQTESRKIIPLLYEKNVDVPANLAVYSRMRYNSNRSDYYWSKLADSIQTLSSGTNNSTLPIVKQTLDSIRYTTETLLQPPSAPSEPFVNRNVKVLGEARQPPYNPQYNTSFIESSDSASSSKSRNKRHPRKLGIECDVLPNVQTNSYPNLRDISFESSRIDGSTLSSTSNSSKEYQSKLYPTMDMPSNSLRNRYTASEDLAISSTQRNTNHNPTHAPINLYTTEAEASPSSNKMDRKNKGTSKLWKKFFKR